MRRNLKKNKKLGVKLRLLIKVIPLAVHLTKRGAKLVRGVLKFTVRAGKTIYKANVKDQREYKLKQIKRLIRKRMVDWLNNKNDDLSFKNQKRSSGVASFDLIALTKALNAKATKLNPTDGGRSSNKKRNRNANSYSNKIGL